MSIPGSKAGLRRQRRIGVLYRKQHGACLLCGEKLSRPTFEHVVPRSVGGGNVDAHCAGGNVALACKTCNHARGTAALTEAQAARLRAWYPRAVYPGAMVMAGDDPDGYAG